MTASPLPLAESRVTRSPSVTNGGDDLTATPTIDQPTAALRLGRMRGLAFPPDSINRRDYSAERETPHLNGTHEIPIDPALAGPTDDPAMVTHDEANRSPFVSLFFLCSSQKSVIGPPPLRRDHINASRRAFAGGTLTADTLPPSPVPPPPSARISAPVSQPVLSRPPGRSFCSSASCDPNILFPTSNAESSCTPI